MSDEYLDGIMKRVPSPTPSEGEAMLALAEYHEKECNRYVNGECMTLRCQRRGYNYERGEVPCYDLASCEAHETALILRAAAQSSSGVREAFRNADDLDWEHLDQMIGYSGHGQFWRAVFKEVRAALSPDTPRKGEK